MIEVAMLGVAMLKVAMLGVAMLGVAMFDVAITWAICNFIDSSHCIALRKCISLFIGKTRCKKDKFITFIIIRVIFLTKKVKFSLK